VRGWERAKVDEKDWVRVKKRGRKTRMGEGTAEEKNGVIGNKAGEEVSEKGKIVQGCW
jgi:hypothetical protein